MVARNLEVGWAPPTTPPMVGEADPRHTLPLNLPAARSYPCCTQDVSVS